MPRLLYVGNFEPAHSTENDVRRAFEAIGWDVEPVQERDFVTASGRGGPRWSAICASALAADLVLHTMTQGSYPDPGRVTELWARCAQAGVMTASVHLDLFYELASPKNRGPERYRLPAVHPMFRVAHVFTPDGWHDAEYARDGVHHHWLPPGVRHDEAVDMPAGPVTLTRHDGSMFVVGPGDALVGFAGSDGYHPEWPHRPQLVEWLRGRYKDRFLHIGGSSTRRVTSLDLNRLYASVPVWVGDSCLTAPHRRYWSDRVPETWGRGGFLVHPRVDALNERYGIELPGSSWTCGDWEALEREVESWLAQPTDREAIRRRVAAVTRANDTYVHRVDEMLVTMRLMKWVRNG